MSKLHTKNGFEYKCNSRNLGGWIVEWEFRPVNEEIFITYHCQNSKTIKADMEELLLSPAVAMQHYRDTLEKISDVPAAERELKAAQTQCFNAHSPDFDIRSNNPNKEARAKKRIDGRLLIAESRLKTALWYTEQIQKTK